MAREENEAQIRVKKITSTSMIGIGANLFLVIFKALIGWMAGSVSIILDAVNNLTDAISSVVTIIGIKLARKPPDKEHPLGHGRVEYFSGIVIALLVFVAGIMSLIESIKKIIHPVNADYSIITIVIVLMAIGVKLFLGIYVKRIGKKYNSDALIGSGTDAFYDAIISISTLVGVLITLVAHISLDGWIGLLIAGFIIKAGVELLLNPVNQVIGARSDSGLTKAIKEDIRSVDGVLGAYDLVLHNYGPNLAIGSVHIEVPDTMKAREIHLLTDKITTLVYTKYCAILTVGIYAVNTEDKKLVEMQEHLKKIVLSKPGVLGIHGIFINTQEKKLSFDTVISFDVNDREELCREIKNDISLIHEGYELNIHFDLNYSD